MGTQSARQVARRAALETQAQRRKERADTEGRISALGVDVMVALGQRDAALELHEYRAGGALRKLIRDEGLTCADATGWCGDLTAKEIKRPQLWAEKWWSLVGRTEEHAFDQGHTHACRSVWGARGERSRRHLGLL